MKHFCILLFFISFSLCYSQNNSENLITQKLTIDSILKNTKNQDYSTKKESYAIIGKLIYKSKIDKATKLYNYTISKDSSAIAKMMLLFQYGRRQSKIGQIEQALKSLNEGLLLTRNLKDIVEETFYELKIGNTYMLQNKPKKALEHLNKAEVLSLNSDSKNLLWNVYYYKALLYGSLKDEKSATENYLKMWNCFNDIENNSQKRFALYLLVDYFSEIKDAEKLAKFTELLSQAYVEANPNMPAGHMPIATIFKNKTSPSHIPLYLKTIVISDSLNNIHSLVHTSFALADAYRNQKSYNKAVFYLQKIEDKLHVFQKPQLLMDTYVKLTNTNADFKNYKEAYRYKILESNLRDSLTSETAIRSIKELEVKYEAVKKDKEIASQQLTLQEKETEILKKERALRIALFSGILLLIASLGIWLFYRQRQKLKNKEIETLKTQKKLGKLEALIEGEEKERKRLAQDLHDGINGDLAVIKYKITLIENKNLNETENKEYNKAIEMLDNAIEQVRHISRNLAPPSLQNFNLVEAIQQYCSKIEYLKVDFQNFGKLHHLNKETETAIYRIVQEAINNIIKHSKATEALVQINNHDDSISITIEDNGIGFNAENSKAGLGLKNIQARTEFLKGELTIDSNKNGTTIQIDIDLNKLDND